jgi:hypothetical protein
MAKSPKKTVNTISDKLVKADSNFSINVYDNGFLIEVSGRDSEDEWATAKIIVSTVDELIVLVREAADMERSG